MADNNEKRVNTGKKRDKEGKFVKGVSGNPSGRPKGSGISITTEIKRKLEEVPKGQKATYLELLINRIFKQAIQDGDSQMIKNIWNYVDGMPVQKGILGLEKDVDVLLDELETDYDKFARQVEEQTMANEQPVQDQEQTGPTVNVQNEPDTGAPHNRAQEPQAQPSSES